MTEPANKERGEITLDLGDIKPVLRPTMEAFVEIEGEFGCLKDIYFRLKSLNVGIKDLARIIVVFAEAAEDKNDKVFDWQSYARRITAEGIGVASVCGTLGDFFQSAIMGGRDPEDDKKAGRQKKARKTSP